MLCDFGFDVDFDDDDADGVFSDCDLVVVLLLSDFAELLIFGVAEVLFFVVVVFFSITDKFLVCCRMFTSREQRYDEQQNHRTQHRCPQCSGRTHGVPPEKRHEPTSQQAADQADNQIDEKARSVTLYDKAGNAPGNQPYKQIP